MMLGLLVSVAGRSSGGGAPPVFDPATLPLSVWLRASFAASPWEGVASAGTSGSHDFAEASTPPSVGTALNGFDPADFNGANDVLVSADTMADFVDDDCSGVVLFNAAAASADAGAGSRLNNPQFFGDGNALIGFGFSSAGVHLAAWPTVGGGAVERVVACGTGAWHMARFRLTDQTTLEVGVDSGAMQTTSFAGLTLHGSRTLACRIGPRGTGAGPFFNGDIAELMITKSLLSDGDFDDIRSYFNARYALSL
jgi:hypothetical protein